MNANHVTLCSSAEWAEDLQRDAVAPLGERIALGDEMLEIGPGPGAATEWLRHHVARLTALELDESAAQALTLRLRDVRVLVGDATAMTFGDETFDSVGCFTMLHHVPTAAAQNRILSEALRVLRPGGVLFGADSLASTDLHDFHVDDTYNPVDPAGLLTRLETIGFCQVTVSVGDVLTFVAYRPLPTSGEGCRTTKDMEENER